MGAPEQEASDSACDRSRPLPSTDYAPQASPSHHHHLLLLQACEAYQALLAQGLVRTADGPRAGSAAAVPPQPSVDVRARRSPAPIGRHLASPQCPCPPRLRPRSPPPCRRRRWLWWRRSDERQAPLGSHARGSYAKHLARTSASKHASQSACLPRSLLACMCDASTRMMQVCWHAVCNWNGCMDAVIVRCMHALVWFGLRTALLQSRQSLAVLPRAWSGKCAQMSTRTCSTYTRICTSSQRVRRLLYIR